MPEPLPDRVPVVLRTERFDPQPFAAELAAGRDNPQIGTRLRYRNDRVRVWEIVLRPGERVPFHAHALEYFFTVVDGGRGRQRTDGDRTVVDREYRPGDTVYVVEDPENPTVHDFENIGTSDLRVVTVELLDRPAR
jgi:quercetin dioxygenase-like cupin family protein